jgi:2-phosphosulfolactate phosphatase
MTNDFDQSPHRVRFDWGRRGVRDAAARGDVVVIVDVLRFSSCVATAAARGAAVYPCRFGDEAEAAAQRVGGRVAGAPPTAHPDASFALVPTFTEASAGERLVLRTLNGAECTLLAQPAAHVFAGALLNASAVARAVEQALAGNALSATIVACGERRHDEAGEALAFAIEDYLGAGAILAALDGDPSSLRGASSSEARVCAAAFRGSRDMLLELLLDCGSGRELRRLRLEDDVRHAAQVDLYDVLPVMREGRYERA